MLNKQNAYITDGVYEAWPLSFDLSSIQGLAESSWKNTIIMNRVAAHGSFFTDYTRGCNGECGNFCQNLSSRCATVKQHIASTLMKPDSISWEVWRCERTGEAVDFVGILRLDRIVLGCDAVGHYFFFDERLFDKGGILKAWHDWCFTDSKEWKGLRRATLEIPSHSLALAAHAVKRLGFGGTYMYVHGKHKIPVEGARQKAVLYNDHWYDLLILGKVNDNGTTEHNATAATDSATAD